MRFLLVSLVLLVGGCAADTGFFVVEKNEVGIVIERQTVDGGYGILPAATQHCAGYGKTPLWQKTENGFYHYSCVAPSAIIGS